MAYVDITSGDTRQQAWAKDKTNTAEKQDILSEGAFVDGDKTRLDQLGATDSPSFNALTLTGANTLSLGTESTNDGSLLIKNSTDANYFELTSGETTTSYSWILPLLAAGGSNYLINVDADGTMGYTDPSTLGGGAPEGTAVLSTGETGGTKYLREDGDGTCSWQTPAGSGDVTQAGDNTFEGTNIFNGGTTIGALAGLVLTDGTETMTASTFAFASNRTLTVGDYDSQWPAASLFTSAGILDANTVDSDNYVDGSIDLVHLSADSVDYTKTTGSIKALTPVTGTAAGFVAGFTGANLYGGTYIVSTTGTVQLPAMLVNMNFTIITSGDIAVIVDTNVADGYLLDGVTGAEGANITNLSTSGDIVHCQYYTADDWLLTSNGWTAE